jgi:hypothetical protein
MKLIYDKWLSMNKEVAYREMVKDTNKAQIKNLGKYFVIGKSEWLNKMKELHTHKD